MKDLINKPLLRLQHRYIGIIILLLPFCLFSCQVVTTQIDSKMAIEGLCFQPDAADYYYELGETYSSDEVEEDELLTDRFSSQALRVANAAGLIPLLRKVVKAEEEINGMDPAEMDASIEYLRYMALRQEFHQHISLINLDVEGITAEIYCERERIRGISEFMAAKRNARRQRYTLLALGVSSMTTVASGVIDLSVDETNADNIISLAGGLVGSGFSLLAAIYQPYTTLEHSPNLLTDIWDIAEESDLYPPFVWNMLRLEERTIEGVSDPPMAVLVTSWEATNFFTDLETEEEVEGAEALFFGEGGEYDISLLDAREEMLNQLQTAIRLIKQEINILLRELHQRE